MQKLFFLIKQSLEIEIQKLFSFINYNLKIKNLITYLTNL